MFLVSIGYNKVYHYFVKNYPRSYIFCDKHKFLIKFIISGCLAGGTDLLLLFIFHGLLKFSLVLATSLAFALAFLISFYLKKFWTFRNYHRDKILSQLFMYLINAFIGLSFNAFFMSLLVSSYNIWYILAQIIVNLIIGFWNFVVYQFIIFKKNKNEVYY